MAKFMVQFRYTDQGLQGLTKEGGSKRRQATRQLVESLGGTLESYYFAFGDHDGMMIIDGLDNVEMTAGSLIGGASGVVHTKTTVLLTPEEVDEAVNKHGNYRPPGQ